jgi:chromosome segregation ATPase
MDPAFIDFGKIAIGSVVAIIGWFLRSTMQELRDVRSKADRNEIELGLLKQDATNKFENLTDRVSELKETLQDLIKEIKALNKRM